MPHWLTTLNPDLMILFPRRDTIREIKRLSTFHFGDHLMRGVYNYMKPSSWCPLLTFFGSLLAT